MEPTSPPVSPTEAQQPVITPTPIITSDQLTTEQPVTSTTPMQVESSVKKTSLPILLGSIFLVLALGGVAYYFSLFNRIPLFTSPPTGSIPEDEMVVCAADAQECSDGSFVGRTGPTCEFVCSDSGASSVIPQSTAKETYTNIKYKYIISYPQNLDIKPGVGGVPGEDGKLENVYQVKLVSKTIPEEQLRIWVAVNKSQYVNLAQFMQNHSTSTTQHKDQTQTVGETALAFEPAFKYVTTLLDGTELLNVSAIKDGFDYTVSLENPTTHPENILTFEEIIADFSFVE